MPRTAARGRLARALHSLRWRLTLSIAALLIGTVGVAFAIVYSQTSAHVSAQIQHDLTADTAQLQQSLRLADGDTAAEELANVRQYVQAQPFRSLSTLLFVLAPRTTISNYPELFAALGPDDGENATQQGAENAEALRFRAPRLGLSTQPLPDVGQVRVLERRVRIDGMPLVIGAGEPLASLHRAQEGVVHSFALAAVFIALAVLLGSYLLGTRLTAPLRRMARVAAQIDAGDLEPRMEIDERRADEVGVLATAFNHMLARLERGFRSQREFIADASHELRTPLTVIQGQLEVLANRREVSHEEVRRVGRLVEGEVARMRRLVDDLLLLAQSDRPDFVQAETIDFERFIGEIWDGATLSAASSSDPCPLAACAPIRTAWRRRSATSSTTRSTTPRRPRGRSVLRRRLSGVDGSGSSCLTMGPASRRTSSSVSSTASTAPVGAARASRARPGSAGPAWGWRSCGRSPRRTTVRFAPPTAPRAGRASSCGCPASSRCRTPPRSARRRP